jgi:hypothetical protein
MAKQGVADDSTKTEKSLQPLYGDSPPYTFEVALLGVKPFLFNQFADLEGYAEEGVSGKKKPANRKRHDYEAMVWRDDDGNLAIPTINVIGSICFAGRYFKSPIASKGSAKNTLTEGLIPASDYASFKRSTWDAVDFRLARNTDLKRSPKPTWRPRLEIGWRVVAHIGVISPEFFTPTNLAEIISRAGASCGIGDGRKIGMGRFVTDGMTVAEGLPW